MQLVPMLKWSYFRYIWLNFIIKSFITKLILSLNFILLVSFYLFNVATLKFKITYTGLIRSLLDSVILE